MADINIQQGSAFARAYKKLHNNQKDAVDQAVKDITDNPKIGEEKKRKETLLVCLCISLTASINFTYLLMNTTQALASFC